MSQEHLSAALVLGLQLVICARQFAGVLQATLRAIWPCSCPKCICLLEASGGTPKHQVNFKLGHMIGYDIWDMQVHMNACFVYDRNEAFDTAPDCNLCTLITKHLRHDKGLHIVGLEHA